ncbi:carboxymuconolactone decarboxylase family protein [Nocardia sp. NPDC052566]|uniref:carboxymuconolactone decarboxylase family protein n=1 Tax=Nocardia sp. NPDC052566 TaxID=3364330 RepID=UPI0037CABB5C
MTDTLAGRVGPHRWRRSGSERATFGRLRDIGPLAWTLSRAGGAITGGRRVHAIEAIGLVPGMLKFYGLYFGYVNSLSRLTRTDSELVILRTAWNCGAYYEWYHHVFVSRLGGLSVEDVARVGAGPSADGWSPRQRAVLTAVDDLTAHRLISDDTWTVLRGHYDHRQLTDLCLLVGNYAMLAMLLNSLGIRAEADAWRTGPLGRLRRGADVGGVLIGGAEASSPGGAAVVHARTKPRLPEPNSTDGVLSRLRTAPHFAAAGVDRIALGAFRDVGPLTWTLSRLGGFCTGTGRVEAGDAIGMDPRMMRHYLPFALKLVLGSHLSRRDTELATLRITWNSGIRYEWLYHAHFSRISGVDVPTVERVAIGPAAPEWRDRERALLTAVDELHADRFITDGTWARLREHYTDRKLAALCLLVGHYDMIGMLFRSYGVEPEPGIFERGPLRWLRGGA